MSLAVAFDFDGTISADPQTFAALMAALRTAGVRLFVLSGDVAATRKLAALGIRQAEHFSAVVTVPVPEEYVAMAKVNVMKYLGVDVLVDNRKQNVTAAAKAGYLALRFTPPKGNTK